MCIVYRELCSDGNGSILAFMVQYGQYPDAYYRVSLKAVIRNDKHEVLCVKENGEWWELPGGGIDHGEDVATALARELKEEIDYDGAFSHSYIDIVTLYDKPNDRCMMLVGVNVTLAEPYTPRCGKDAREVAWVNPASLTKEEARASRSIVKFAHDPSHKVAFIRDY